MSDLVPVPTLKEADEAFNRYLPENFPLSNEDAFSTFYTWKKLVAQGHVDTRAFIRDLYPQGFVMTATGAWLDLHAADHNLTRIPERRTEGLIDFYVSEIVNVPAGTVVQTPTDAVGQTYRFVVSHTTKCEPPLTRVPVRAESLGAAWNVGAGRITTLVTALDEVQFVTNLSDWLTTPGVDRETDESLRRRLQLVWPELGSGSTYHAYEAWAREVQGVVKVAIIDTHPRGQGTVDVVIAPTIGLPSAELIAQAQRVVTARKPITSDPLVRGPSVREVGLELILHLRSSDLDSQPVWESRARAVLEKLDINETFYPSTVGDALHNFSNVKGVEILTPSSPVVPPAGGLIVPVNVTVSVKPS